jgi:hypothetical protein
VFVYVVSILLQPVQAWVGLQHVMQLNVVFVLLQPVQAWVGLQHVMQLNVVSVLLQPVQAWVWLQHVMQLHVVSILLQPVQAWVGLQHMQYAILWCVSAVYLYSGDDRLRLDSSVLLCLLLYSDFILLVPEPVVSGSPWHCLSLPELVPRHMRLPFLCHTHWQSSPHTQPSVTGRYNGHGLNF